MCWLTRAVLKASRLVCSTMTWGKLFQNTTVALGELGNPYIICSLLFTICLCSLRFTICLCSLRSGLRFIQAHKISNISVLYRKRPNKRHSGYCGKLKANFWSSVHSLQDEERCLKKLDILYHCTGNGRTMKSSLVDLVGLFLFFSVDNSIHYRS